MGKKKCPECPKCLPGWLAQFGDLMSLLLVFFVLLLSMAVMDKKKVEEYFDIMRKAMGFLDQTSDVREQTDKHSDQQSSDSGGMDDGTQNEVEDSADEIAEVVEIQNQMSTEINEQITMTRGKNEFVLDIPSTIMFEDGEYKLKSKMGRLFIARVARVLRTMPQSFDIEVIGHTDKGYFRSNSIPRDNWDVSALRSISVIKELMKNKIDPSLLKVAAYSSFRPKSDNAAENRRVEMRFVSRKVQHDLFEEENFFDRIEQ
jgi:chemotaxis protein MotB